MKKKKKSPKPESKCPDNEPGCAGLKGRKLRICGNCYVEKNYGTRPGEI